MGGLVILGRDGPRLPGRPRRLRRVLAVPRQRRARDGNDRRARASSVSSTTSSRSGSRAPSGSRGEPSSSASWSSRSCSRSSRSRSSDIGTDLSFFRSTAIDLGVFFYVWVFMMIAASSNGVNLTDGLDGLAVGSAAQVLGAFVVVAFWQFRHQIFYDLARHRFRSVRSGDRCCGARSEPARASCGGTRPPRRSSWATPAR